MALDDKTKQDLESALEHAVRVVQTRIAQFEQNVYVPCLESSRRFADRRPITAILISIFGLLSFLPVASFIAFAILVTVAFVFIGLGGAFIASSILVVAAGGVLAFILGALFLASVFLTGTVVTLFVTFRLMQHLSSRSDFKQGLAGWAHETRGRLRWPIAQSKESFVSEKREPSAPSGSDEWHPISSDHGGKT